MMLAYPDLLSSGVTGPAPTPLPLISPTMAPAYVQPVSTPIRPNPAIASPPPSQFRGEGGTSFGLKPNIYIQAPLPAGLEVQPTIPTGDVRTQLYVQRPVSDGGVYMPPPNTSFNPNDPAPQTPVTKDRPGDALVMPVPVGQVPAKSDIGTAVVPVTVPGGPIKGSVLGLDLGVVPLWAWLVGAAILGARVLR